MAETITAEQVRPHDLLKVSQIIRMPSKDEVDAGFVARGEAGRMELLHRPQPKPPVGTVLTGKQVKARMWKRGTTLICTFDASGDGWELTLFELLASGKWKNHRQPTWGVELLDDDRFILVYRPEEESDK